MTAAAPTASEPVREDLRRLAGAVNLCDWMFDQFAASVGPRAVEVGAGIGTFSRRLLAAGVRELLLLEPDDELADELGSAVAQDERVTVVREAVPGSDALARVRSSRDLVLCQNVLEHVDDDAAAVAEMAASLAPGGTLALLVPAYPSLYGRLDEEYGHFRRYDRERLRRLLDDAGLEVTSLYGFNLLAVPGWWVANHRSRLRIDAASLRIYEALVPIWRRIENRVRPRVGLSLVATARKPLVG